jgi:antitoxin (DNA-binding transcriptional repressor) of toxin-antitoxin stability system
MTTVSIEEAEGRLSELIHQLKPGDEVIITENNQAVAKLVGQAPVPRKPRQPGSAKGKLVIHAEDDEHLEDFREYMP